MSLRLRLTAIAVVLVGRWTDRRGPRHPPLPRVVHAGPARPAAGQSRPATARPTGRIVRHVHWGGRSGAGQPARLTGAARERQNGAGGILERRGIPVSRAGGRPRQVRHCRSPARRERHGQRPDARRDHDRGRRPRARRRTGLLGGRIGVATARTDRGDRRRDRRGRPLAAGGRHRSPHRGGPAGDRPERDARPDRGGVCRTPRVRAPAAAVRGRRVARAAHAAHVGARIRRALSPRRGRPPGRPRQCHEPHRGRVGPHGPAGRRPAAAGAARPGPAARTRARRPQPPGRRPRGRRSGDRAAAADRTRPPPIPSRSTATTRGCARRSETCWPTPAPTPRPTRP